MLWDNDRSALSWTLLCVSVPTRFPENVLSIQFSTALSPLSKQAHHSAASLHTFMHTHTHAHAQEGCLVLSRRPLLLMTQLARTQVPGAGGCRPPREPRWACPRPHFHHRRPEVRGAQTKEPPAARGAAPPAPLIHGLSFHLLDPRGVKRRPILQLTRWKGHRAGREGAKHPKTCIIQTTC